MVKSDVKLADMTSLWRPGDFTIEDLPRYWLDEVMDAGYDGVALLDRELVR